MHYLMLKRENHFMGRLDNTCQIEEWDKNKNYKRPEREINLYSCSDINTITKIRSIFYIGQEKALTKLFNIYIKKKHNFIFDPTKM